MAEEREAGLIHPEVQWAGDGIVVVSLFLPAASASRRLRHSRWARR